MIHFDEDQFDHGLTGYHLLGRHVEIHCRTCHKSENITDPKVKSKSSTYLGLDQKCQSCHPDYHQGSLSSDCTSCHDFNHFKPASNFNHNLSRFPLIGKHVQVDCNLCHKLSIQNGKETRQFAGISFGKCTNCHRDIHENKFGQNCTKCHSEVSFHQVKGMNNFNHARTNYTLDGKHQAVACAGCHKTGYTKALKHNRCSNCHSDAHKKQFSVRGKSPDCSECHSTHGFERSSFTVERHNESQFQLTGAHLATPCFTCHKKDNKWTFREIGEKCIDCHKNIHESTLDNKYDPEATCINCHNSNSWSELEFDHSKTGYQLEGAHLRQTCRSCHFKESAPGLLVQQFSQLSSNCTNCHQDVHQQQFEGPAGTDCLKCHDYFDWSAGLFEHNQTVFPLDGKHKNVACVKCHPRVVTPQLVYTQFKLKSFTCESCH